MSKKVSQIKKSFLLPIKTDINNRQKDGIMDNDTFYSNNNEPFLSNNLSRESIILNVSNAQSPPLKKRKIAQTEQNDYTTQDVMDILKEIKTQIEDLKKNC